MAKFCTQCGTPLHPEYGFCPSCEKDIIQKMAGVPNFCTICGGKVDKETGVCPGCGHKFGHTASTATAAVKPETPATPAAETKDDHVQNSEPAPQAISEPAPQPVPQPAPRPAPVSPQPAVKAAPPKAAPKPEKPKRQKKHRVGSVVITIVLCIFLFISTFAGIMLYSARSMATDEEKIEMLMDTVTVSEFLDLMGDAYKQAFYDALRDFVKEKTGATLTPRKLDELAERSTIKGEISKQLAVYVSDIVEDESKFNLNRKSITNLLKKNRSAVEKVLEAEVSDEVLETIAKWLVDDAVMDTISPRAIKENQPLIYYAIHIGLSWLGIIVFLLLMALFVFLLFCNSPSQAGISSGLVFTIVGGITTAVSVATMFAPSLTMSIINNNLITSAVNVFFSSNILVYVVILAIGIAALVTSIVAGKMVAKRKAV